MECIGVLWECLGVFGGRICVLRQCVCLLRQRIWLLRKYIWLLRECICLLGECLGQVSLVAQHQQWNVLKVSDVFQRAGLTVGALDRVRGVGCSNRMI